MANKENQKENLIVLEEIENKIYNIRGERVMLDSDLAEIYGVETRVLKQAVRRNLHRFPNDFMFELTLEELRKLESLRSQIVILDAKDDGKSKRGKYGKYKPFVFTEHGAVMLASVLNSQIAIEASIKVVRAFVKIRSILALHQDLADRIEELGKVTDFHEHEFEVVFQLLGDIMRDPKYLKGKIGFIQDKKGKSKK